MKKEIIKVYFDSNFSRNGKDEIIIQKIITLLNKFNCNVVQTLIGVDLGYLENQGKKAAGNIYNSKLKDIIDNEIFVCDISFPSVTLSFEIFEALKLKKPVLALYHDKSLFPPDIAFLGNPSPLLFLSSYNEDSLESIIENFLKNAKNKIPIDRFTVRLSKEISDYLNFLKITNNCSSKNEVLVNLLEKMISEDDKFQRCLAK